MKEKHLIRNENRDIYKRLKKFYANKDFRTLRTAKEKEIEFDIINELPDYIINFLDNVSSNNYLENLSKMDSSTPGFTSFINAMESSLNAMISCTNSK